MGIDVERYEEFHGIKLLSGPDTHPGSGPPAAHEKEYKRFLEAINELNPEKQSPVMLELGAYWGLWSLVFRQRFPKGSNILIEYGSHQLAVGVRNFQLNDYDADFIHGGIFLEESGTASRASDDIEFAKGGILGRQGPELDLLSLFNDRQNLDLIHADIQGSELKFIEFFIDHNFHNILSNKMLIIATHSAKNHLRIRKILGRAGYHVLQEDATYGRLGILLFRALRLIGRDSRESLFRSKTFMNVLLYLEWQLRVTGQTQGVGQDGWLVFKSNR
jgi:hypothetical protein